MFKVGDKAVYPAHGVGVIEGIESKEISGSTMSFFVLRILETDITILVPVKNIDKVGLRALIGKKDIDRVFAVLKEKPRRIDNQTWNRRYREYMEKIKTGSLLEVAQVLRDLVVLKKQKELSFGERKVLDTARGLLIRELALAARKKEPAIEKEIDDLLS
jgi:CarD family transcriptional regulator